MYGLLPLLPPLAVVSRLQADLVLCALAVALVVVATWVAMRLPSGRQQFVMELYARCCGEEHTPKPHRLSNAA